MILSLKQTIIYWRKKVVKIVIVKAKICLENLNSCNETDEKGMQFNMRSIKDWEKWFSIDEVGKILREKKI